MTRVPLRDFQLSPSKYLASLPIELTRYDVVIATVNAPGKVLTQSVNTSPSVNTLEDKKPKSVNTSQVTHPIEVPRELPKTTSTHDDGYTPLNWNVAPLKQEAYKPIGTRMKGHTKHGAVYCPHKMYPSMCRVCNP